MTITENLKMLSLEELEVVAGGAAPSRRTPVSPSSPSRRCERIGWAISDLILYILKSHDKNKK